MRSARVEAMGARNGIGLVKLMGRHSGFVACQAALASADVDLVLIPEIEATLEGERGVLGNLDRVLARKGHAVVVVAEGAAQDLMDDDARADGTDKSGNAKLKDVGVFLRERITAHYERAGREVTLKYFDPSYTIRSVPATPSDSVYCWNMARNAVHAAMAGNTEMLIGRWHGRFVHVPMALATRNRKRVDVTRRSLDVGDRGDRTAARVRVISDRAGAARYPGPTTVPVGKRARRRGRPRVLRSRSAAIGASRTTALIMDRRVAAAHGTHRATDAARTNVS